MYIYRLLYRNLMVTTEQKYIIDMQTQKKKESKHNANSSHQMIRMTSREQKKKKGTK